jgi:hypothetical protein
VTTFLTDLSKKLQALKESEMKLFLEHLKFKWLNLHFSPKKTDNSLFHNEGVLFSERYHML